ncbi:hypothetical protein [Desulfobacula toluolica]|uniref:Uncharacterized protein n=1 Tax=Desulfobacula toluolica (strain DSM 7467 / Tol2) TaxID=651182 RepID=K0NLF4_DESTT|nr:hypothetical protein [Desulfobacula toluolica]CCK82411.1 uncharacterized protein TOL2_C42550 [Desulfobacula toluolica Tol2]
MNKDLNAARELLKNIHPENDFGIDQDNNFDPVIVTEHPDYTVMVSANDFGDAEPLVEIIRNEDLLKLYGYTVRCSEGDPAFDDFDGNLLRLGNNDIESTFVDLFNVLVTIGRNNVCRVMDYETYLRKTKPKLTIV